MAIVQSLACIAFCPEALNVHELDLQILYVKLIQEHLHVQNA